MLLLLGGTFTSKLPFIKRHLNEGCVMIRDAIGLNGRSKQKTSDDSMIIVDAPPIFQKDHGNLHTVKRVKSFLQENEI